MVRTRNRRSTRSRVRRRPQALGRFNEWSTLDPLRTRPEEASSEENGAHEEPHEEVDGAHEFPEPEETSSEEEEEASDVTTNPRT